MITQRMFTKLSLGGFMNRSWHVAHRILFSIYTGVLLDRKVKWTEPLPDEPVIFAVNHPTTTDPFLIPLLTKRPLTILITQKAFDVPWFGPILKAAGHLCVPELYSGGEDLINRAVDKLKEGRSVCIFPEGNLSPDMGEFLAPHTGVARLALLSGAPVVPVGIHMFKAGTTTTQTVTKNFTSTSRWAVRGPYYVTIGKAARYEGDLEDRERVRQVMHQIMDTVKEEAWKSRDRLMQEQPLWQPLSKLLFNQLIR
jgi:1-acyl-sn-glycerol-3-phosphate acyltransferase